MCDVPYFGGLMSKSFLPELMPREDVEGPNAEDGPSMDDGPKLPKVEGIVPIPVL